MKSKAYFSRIGKKGIKLRWKREHSKINLPKDLTKEKAMLHAYLCGDGYINIRNEKNRKAIHYEISFYPDDKTMLETICNCFLLYAGIKIKNITKKGIMYSARIKNKIVCKDLLKLGNYGTYSWEIPLRIRKNFPREWIRCFFDCEAHVHHKGRIQVKSVNYAGLVTVNKMLRSLKIWSNLLGPYKQKIGKEYFVLDLKKKELKKYSKEVGFTHSEKVKKLNFVLNQ